MMSRPCAWWLLLLLLTPLRFCSASGAAAGAPGDPADATCAPPSESTGAAAGPVAEADEALLIQKHAKAGDGHRLQPRGGERRVGRDGSEGDGKDPAGFPRERDADKARLNLLREQEEWARGGITEPAPSCKSHTGGTCNIGDCWLWRGPTECVRPCAFCEYTCVCQKGYCANADGVCTLPAGPLAADVAPVNAASPAFPNHQATLATGMCFSGGGIRALTWALGGLRPLLDWGLMSKVDVISSVSGGSWANAIFMFAPGDTQEILGGPTDPRDLNMAVLGQDPPPGIRPVTVDALPVILDLVAKGSPLDLLLANYCCEVFLKPFGLCDMWAFMAPDVEAVVRTRRANPKLESVAFQVPRADRPRAMIIKGTLLAPEGYSAAPGDEVSLEMSPGYIGSPFYPGSGYIDYEPLRIPLNPFRHRNLSLLVGGGLLESFAFGGPPSRKAQSAQPGAVVGTPALPFSLAQAIAISSMALGATLGNIPGVGKLTDPMYEYWPVVDADHPSEHGMQTYKMSDGGHQENSGLLPLLQRGVKKVVWFAASYELVNRSYNLCDVPTDGDGLVKAKVIDQVLDKFGFGPELTNGRPSNALLRNQVFERSKVHGVVCQLQQHLTDGTPPVLSFTEKVLDNEWWGIVGGWTVEVVLVYLEHSREFEGLLPPDTQKQLAFGKKGAFAEYPAYGTRLGGGTNAQYNLLAATSEYFVRQNEGLLRKILS